MAVINQLAAEQVSTEIRFWCDRGYKQQATGLIQQATIPVKVSTVLAGKLRRYHGTTTMQKLLDIPTILHNIFDVFLVLLGFLQSFIKLIIWRPKAIFLKGGFVCLPVGYAAFILRIPIVIHDSDAHAGLANRLLAPLATYIATGVPLEYYNYPTHKAQYVGIPVQSLGKPLTHAQKNRIKQEYGVSLHKPLVVVTGGGLGAKRINDAIITIAPKLIESASIIHLSGVAQYDELKGKALQNDDYKLISFMSDGFEELVGAADLVISRAGASSLAEMAAVGANVLLVPNAQLVGGHQVKNAKIYLDKGAVATADEMKFTHNPILLLNQIRDLLRNDTARNALGTSLYTFAKPDAAKDVVKLIIKAAKL